MHIYGLQFDTTDKSLGFTPALQAFYINGRYATPPEYGRGRVYIDVTGAAPRDAFWLDVENEDASPEQVPGWLDQRAAAHLGAGGIYVNRDNLPAVEHAAAHRPHYLWIATLDGTIDIPPVPGIGVLALVQAFPASMIGMNTDISVVVDRTYWEGRHA